MADEIKQDEGCEVPPDPFPGLTERISALTPEDMLDTSAEDQRDGKSTSALLRGCTPMP
jgi:hypothetical protein